MLNLSLKPGDYFTVGDDTVIQMSRLTGDRVHLTVTAPKEIPILRGDVLERNGGARPECVQAPRQSYTRQLPWSPEKKAALQQLRRTLSTMQDSPETRALHRELDKIFPAQEAIISAK